MMKKMPILLASVMIIVSLSGCLGDEENQEDVVNEPPVASITPVEIVLMNTAISFDASSSSDSDGNIQSYHWDFGDGTTSEGQSPSHTYEEPGTYTVTLTVTDNDGSESTTTTVVVVNAAPEAIIEVDSTTVLANEGVLFRGSSSSDSDGTIESYKWSFGDGSESTLVDPTHTYPHTGVFSVQLVVTDDAGATGEAQTTITVELTTYKVTWSIVNESKEIQNNTQENSTTTINHTISDDNLISVLFELSWRDNLPAIHMLQDPNDEFKLTVTSPMGTIRSVEGLNQSLELEFPLASVPQAFTVKAGSASEVEDDLEEYYTTLGQGIWVIHRPSMKMSKNRTLTITASTFNEDIEKQ